MNPVTFFNLFWDESILDQIVKSTNAYALAKRGACAADSTGPVHPLAPSQRKCKPLNKTDLRRLLVITTLIGVVWLPSRRLCWPLCHGSLGTESLC